MQPWECGVGCQWVAQGEWRGASEGKGREKTGPGPSSRLVSSGGMAMWAWEEGGGVQSGSVDP